MKLVKKVLCAVAVFGLVIGVGAAMAQDKAPADKKMKGTPPTKNIVEQLAGADKMKVFSELVKTAGLAEELAGKGPFVVFAPTDDAFAAMPKEKLDAAKKDAAAAKALVANLYTTQEVNTRSIEGELKVKTVGGAELTVKAGEGRGALLVNDAKSAGRPMMATNGRVIGIDKVLAK